VILNGLQKGKGLLPGRGDKEKPFHDIPNWDGVEIRHQGLLEKIRIGLRTLHYSYRTEQTYLEWICRFLSFHNLKDPVTLGTEEIKKYLEYLATERDVAGSTQRQALNALVFLYAKALNKPLGEIGPYERPKKPKRLPVVFTKSETARVLQKMSGTYALMAGLLYGSGLRLKECIRLRVKDVDFESRQILVRDGKGAKDRLTMLPEKYMPTLQEHLVKVKEQHNQDLAQGYGAVYLWPSIERKYRDGSFDCDI